ncbi:MAG: hypothetical protein KatS3mg048_4200 [Caldilinea sp.]|nr:MAG: hypothetical protein KatS3mg048_4200 [Caldilinea sp.]
MGCGCCSRRSASDGVGFPPLADTEHLRFIVPRVLELTYTAWNLAPFAADVWREADDALRAAILESKRTGEQESTGLPLSPSPALPLSRSHPLPLSQYRLSGGTKSAALFSAPSWTPTTPGSTA